MRPRIGQLLLDFDGVLATHHRDRRLAALAAHAGVEVATVHAVLYTSGLERRYDAGLVDTAGYLRTLGDGLGRTVGEAAWLAARRAASVPDAGAQARIAALPADLPLGVLTNNGPLMATLIPELLPSLAERLRGKVLCSASLGGRKPDPALFQRALARLGWEPRTTLFIDDLFVNVRGARAAGLHADSVRDARSLGRVLRRFGLVPATPG